MGQFNPNYYRLYRPYYPVETFAGLEASLRKRGFRAPFAIADIGCGTGHSAISLLRAGIDARITGVDPDPGMLEQARQLAQPFGDAVRFQSGRGESSGLADASMDAVLIGSAFHWMDPIQTHEEALRILRPRGILRIFEYQFPKAIELSELNDWIRRQFNLLWKAPGQVPRGSFQQITARFRASPRFELIAEEKPPMILTLQPEEVVGLILSQSRVLHYQATLPESEVPAFHDSVRENVLLRMPSGPARFDFKLSWVEFGSLILDHES